jgi:hypothetical protein
MSDVLTPEEAIHAMMDGETLVDLSDYEAWFDGDAFPWGPARMLGCAENYLCLTTSVASP